MVYKRIRVCALNVEDLMQMQSKNVGSTPWPFTNSSAICVDRTWAAYMLSLQRRHDKHKARLVLRDIKAWRVAWGWNRLPFHKDKA